LNFQLLGVNLLSKIDTIQLVSIMNIAVNLTDNDNDNFDNDNFDNFIDDLLNEVPIPIDVGTSTKFDLSTYFKLINAKIRDILQRDEKTVLTYDILDSEKLKAVKLISLKEKHRQMKIGEIWQVVIGNYDGCVDLKIGHETGLDIVSHSRKFAIELKNRTNTDNSSSKKTNLDKLARFKISNPDYTCIYANINADTKEKTLKGSNNKIVHNGVEIEHQIGYQFLNYVFGENTDEIIEFLKVTLESYSSSSSS
jgi:hypothetical protein